jgi:hypothetical protein
MLLELLIALIVLVVVVIVVKYLWGLFELPPDLLRIVLIIIGAIFMIYLLMAVWPFISNPGGWQHHWE